MMGEARPGCNVARSDGGVYVEVRAARGKGWWWSVGGEAVGLRSV
jgi:hypothetical protein